MTVWWYHYSVGQTQICKGPLQRKREKPTQDEPPGGVLICSTVFALLQSSYKCKQTKTKVKQQFQHQWTCCPSAGRLACLGNGRQRNKAHKELLLTSLSISVQGLPARRATPTCPVPAMLQTVTIPGPIPTLTELILRAPKNNYWEGPVAPKRIQGKNLLCLITIFPMSSRWASIVGFKSSPYSF